MAKRDAVPGLGEKLKAAREAAGLTQTAAAESAGVPQVNISAFENDVKTPTVATLLKLATVYGVGIGELVPSPAIDEVAQ